jgi:DNA-binding transcriptional LysR family regulator
MGSWPRHLARRRVTPDKSAMKVNLRLLHTFLEVAEHGSFRHAAEAIGRTQSAVSMQIQQLERQLSLRLFHRTTRQVRLTTEGEELLAHVRIAMAELMAGLRQAAALSPSSRGRVAIACAPSVAGSRLPAVMAAFQAAFPNVSARLSELPLDGILEAVRKQEVDFGLGPTPSSQSGIEFRPMLVEPICALLPGVLARRRKQIGLRELAGYSIVVMGGLRSEVEHAAQGAGISLSMRYEAQQFLTVQGLVRVGLGVGIVPRIAVVPELRGNLRALPITDPTLTREVGMITQRGRPLSPIAIAFGRMLQEMLAG